jgi:hypothetical protein
MQSSLSAATTGDTIQLKKGYTALSKLQALQENKKLQVIRKLG